MNIESNNRKIKIDDNIITLMKKYIQTSRFSKESGGLLIGRENCSDNNLIIEYITEPFPKDKRKYNRFYRRDEKHIDSYQSLYEFSFQVYAYIGEWHTHHESIPNYSKIDYENWVKIGKESPITKEFYHIIIGNKAFKIWEYDNTHQKISLINTTFWRNI